MPRKIFAAIVVVVFLYVTSPLITPVAMGAVLAVLLFPLLIRMEARKVPSSLASGVLTIGMTMIFLLPTTLLLFFIAKSGFQQLQTFKEAPKGGGGWIQAFLDTPAIHTVFEWIANRFPVGMQELLDAAQDLVYSIGLKLTDLLGGVMTLLPGAVMALAVMIVSTYFFLVDGRNLMQFVRRISIFTPPQTEQLTRTMGGVCRSVILASLVSGAVQAVVEMISCLMTSTPNVMLIGGLVFMGSFIPLIGSAPVTLGVALQQLIAGRTNAAFILFITAIIVASLDNFLRPLVLRGAANLHPLLAFVAAFGGLQTLGVLGIFLGPIVAAMFIAIVQLIVDEVSARRAR